MNIVQEHPFVTTGASPEREASLSTAILVVAGALMTVGLVLVASTTVSLDHSLLEARLWRAPFGRQLVFALFGLLGMVATARLAPPLMASPPWRHRAAIVLFVLAVAALVATFLPGLADPHQGSHRWIRLGPAGMAVRYQPSELAKVALVAFIAASLARPGLNPRSFRAAFVPTACAVAATAALVGIEDFGTAALIAAVGVSMLIVAGCRLRHVSILAAIGAAGMAGLLIAFPYRLARIAAFRDVWADPQGHGYQAVQSLTTIASGGWFGRGLGAGVQKYGYLPASHTDFIFSVLCEETGVLGGAMVIFLFTALIGLGWRVTWTASSPFERLLAFGLTAMIGLQAAMNIAVVTVVAPTKGISLPLLSAGGSGLLTVCLAVGLLAALARTPECRMEEPA